MNKVILMGRLTRDPEIRYSQTNDIPIANYTLAVDRPNRNSSDGPTADLSVASASRNLRNLRNSIYARASRS